MTRLTWFMYGMLFLGVGTIIITLGFEFLKPSEKPTITKVQFIIPDRVKECENSGGKYTLRYSDITKKYTEYCDIEAKELFNNDIEFN